MSNNRVDETVDAFGRTVVVAQPRNTGRVVVAATSPREARAAPPGETRNRSQSNAGSRFDEQVPSFPQGHQRPQHHGNQHGQQHRQQQQFHHHQHDRNDWDGNHRAVRYQERRDDYHGGGGNRRHGNQQAIVQPYNPNRIAPILSFKSFMQEQRDDLPPEAFQRLYDQYHLNYLQEFSDRFFQESMMEEWFQDRYSPVRIHAQEQATAARAVTESASLLASFAAHPVASVKAVCLDPPPHPKGKRGPGNAGEAAVPEVAVEPAAEVVPSADGVASDVPVATKHLPGHEDRTLYIAGIHASCTRSALLNAITAALAPPADAEMVNEADDIPALERFLFSQPVWTSTDGNDKFERFAWIVMPTAAAAKLALRKLSDLRVEVPYPMDPADAEPVVEFAFTVHARPHTPKVYYEKFETASHYQRVEADTVRALELAALLDEDRNVPEETRLAALLQHEAVVAAMAKPTDRLDVAIAYLRRVHLANFYGAKRFRDEAHLLSLSPSVPHRVKQYVAPPSPSDAAAMEEEGGGEVEASVGGKRKHDTEEEEGASSAITDAVNAAPGGMEVEGAVKPPPPPGRPGQRVVSTASPRMEAMLAELREKVAHSRRRAADPSLPGTPDEEDAKALSELQEKTFERCVMANLKPEKEGKCRCCYVSCNKLFKGADFLTKHMRLKHEDFATDLLLQDAQPFMRRRYEAEPMGARPLPPVEVEAHGRTELKSVKVILDKYMPQSALPPREPRGERDPVQRRGQGEGRRGQDDRDRRGQQGGNNAQGQGANRQQVQFVQPTAEQAFPNRKISSYVDVDAPKESAVSIEYGVALPPIKKRRTATAVKKTTSMDEGETA